MPERRQQRDERRQQRDERRQQRDEQRVFQIVREYS